MKLNLKDKLALSAVVIILLTSAISVYTIHNVQKNALSHEFRERGITITKNLAHNMENPFLMNDIVSLKKAVDELKNTEDVLYVFLTDSSGQIIVHSFDDGFPRQLKDANIVGNDQEYGIVLLDTNEGYVQDIAVPLLGGIGFAHVGLSENRIRGEIWATTKSLIGIMALAVTGGCFLIYFAGSIITKPINKLTKGTLEISRGNLDYDLNIKSGDEVGTLAQSFTQMARNLKNHIRSLENTKKFLENLINNIDDSIVVIDKNYTIVMANRYKRQFFSDSDIVGRHCYEIVYGLNKPCPETDCPHRKVMETGKAVRLVHSYKDEKGYIRYMEISASPFKDENGDLLVIEVARDITERLKLQHEILLRNRELSALNEVIQLISSPKPLSQSLKQVAEYVAKIFGTDRCIIMLYDESVQTHTLMAEYCNTGVESIQNIELPVKGNPHFFKVIHSDEPVASDDTWNDSVLASQQNILRQLKVRSMIVSSIKNMGSVIGTIAIHAGDIRKWTRDDIKLFGSISSQLGVAIENAKLFEEIIKYEEDYYNLYENAVFGMFTLDLSGNILSVNKGCLKMAGYSREELIRSNISNYLTPDSLNFAYKTIHRIEQGETMEDPFTLNVIKKDSSIALFEFKLQAMKEYGKVVGIHGIMWDVNSRQSNK